MPDTTPWYDRRHPLYDEMVRRYNYAKDHFSGDVRDKAIKQASTLQEADKNAPLYMTRRVQGESVDAYRERVQISRYPRHMSRVVGSFVGSLFLVEDKAVRKWGIEDADGAVTEGLGLPEDEASVMHRLWLNADGSGTPYATVLSQVAHRIVWSRRTWYLADPLGPEGEDARVCIIETPDVLNWYEDAQGLVWVLVREVVDRREDPYAAEEEGAEERLVLYTTEGFTRYRITGEGKDRRAEEIPEESGAWRYPILSPSGRARLPVSYVELPFEQDVGYLVAQDANYLYNLLSDPRALLRLANHPKLAPMEAMDERAYDQAAQDMAKGYSFLSFPAQYIAPPGENAKVAYETYKEEVADFYRSSFQEYEDRAREVTATEAMQQMGGGRYSFLSLVARALDEFENDVLFLWAQYYHPKKPQVWAAHGVERSRDFQPIDAEDRAAKLKETYFGIDTVPAGPQGLVRAAMEISSLHGIDADEDEVKADIESRTDEAERERGAMREVDALLSERMPEGEEV